MYLVLNQQQGNFPTNGRFFKYFPAKRGVGKLRLRDVGARAVDGLKLNPGALGKDARSPQRKPSFSICTFVGQDVGA